MHTAAVNGDMIVGKKPFFHLGLAVGAICAGLSMSSSAVLSVELTWAALKPNVSGQRLITRNDQVVKLEAPYRATDDRPVPVSVQTSLPNGAKVKSVPIIIDENPMPVSPTVRPEQKRSSLWVSASMRFNGPSPVREIVEAENAQLFMSEAMVKTSGLGACAAPPTTTLDVATKTMGDMRLSQILTPLHVLTIAKPVMRTKLDISHPNLTGLQLDQITLRYILPRYVEKVAIEQGDEKLMTIEAGISLAENPSGAFDYVSNGAEKMQIEAQDTDETVFRHSLQINPGS